MYMYMQMAVSSYNRAWVALPFADIRVYLSTQRLDLGLVTEEDKPTYTIILNFHAFQL